MHHTEFTCSWFTFNKTQLWRNPPPPPRLWCVQSRVAAWMIKIQGNVKHLPGAAKQVRASLLLFRAFQRKLSPSLMFLTSIQEFCFLSCWESDVRQSSSEIVSQSRETGRRTDSCKQNSKIKSQSVSRGHLKRLSVAILNASHSRRTEPKRNL